MYKTPKILIFGGTSEGRELAESCLQNGISTLVCVTTELGAKQLPQNAQVTVGRLDAEDMAALISRGFPLVIDATHPYAVEASANIRIACEKTGVRLYRVIRELGALDVPAEYGKTVSCMEALIGRLNTRDGVILSTLGSKEAADLTKVSGYSKRVWLRILPIPENIERCLSLGFEHTHLIAQKGPFTLEQNTEHIKKSGASILVTKNSGAAGGYPEKVKAARECGIELITLGRPPEQGISLEKMKEIIRNAR